MEKPNRHTSLSDDQLLQAYRSSNDNQWLGLLLQRYTVLLLGVAMKYLKDKEQAQDAVQHVFLKALTHLPQDEIYNFKGWLYILMRNHCLQLLRHKTFNLSEIPVNLTTQPLDKEHIEWKDYTLEQMNAALAELNEDQRKCITLFYLDKLSYQQIMEQTGFTFIQVKSYIQNGKRNLKLILLKKLSSGNHE